MELIDYIIEFDNISKSFPGVKAIDSVTFGIRKGEVHALVGENGAGKSTLIKLCSGVYTIDKGKILWDGKYAHIKSTIEAQKLGISVVYQEPALCQNMTVASNIFLGRELTTKRGSLDWKAMYEITKKSLEVLGIEIDPKAYVSELNIVQRQVVEITKALSINSKLIIMDEPTSALAMDDTKKLFQIINNLKSKGVTLLYVSHRLDEIFEIADTITVLRDGKHITTKMKNDTNPEEIATLMIGRKFIDMFPEILNAGKKIVLKVVDLSSKGNFENVSFVANEGEILGLAGLRGSGNSNLLRTIFGIEKADMGEIYINGESITIKSPKDAMRGSIGYIAADRHEEGLFLQMNVRDNISFLILNKLKRLGFISSAKKNVVSNSYVKELNIRTPSISQLVEYLSGGNQQKVAVAKWLATKAKILLMDDPTRGVDVGAKVEIHNLINNLAKQDNTILVTSSELQELIGICHRVLIMHKGKIVAEFSKDDISEEKIIKYATGAIA